MAKNFGAGLQNYDLKHPKKKRAKSKGTIDHDLTTNAMNFGGSAGANLGELLMKNQRISGIDFVARYTGSVTETNDYNTIMKEFNKSKKSVWDMEELRKRLVGNARGGYILPAERSCSTILAGKNGMSKQPEDFLYALCTNPRMKEWFKTWRIWVSAPLEAHPKINLYVDVGSPAGATCSGIELCQKSVLARRTSAEIGGGLKVTYLEFERNKTDWAKRNQILHLTPHLLTNSSAYNGWIVYDDGQIHSDHGNQDIDNIDATRLSRQQADKLVSRGLNGLLATKSINPRYGATPDPSDILGSINRNCKSKIIAVLGGLFKPPTLKRAKIYQLANKVNKKVDKERIDQDAYYNLLYEIFLQLKLHPWELALTSLNVDYEMRWHRSSEAWVVLSGGGLHSSDTHIAEEAWERARMYDTKWTLVPAVYSNSPLLGVTMFLFPRSGLPALESIYDVSYECREVRSFKSLIKAKDLAPYKEESIDYCKTTANTFNVHWKRPFSLVRQKRSLSEIATSTSPIISPAMATTTLAAD